MRLRPALIVLPFFLSACFPFGGAIKDQSKALLKEHPDALKTLQSGSQTLRYAAAGPVGKPLVLLIHGSPGSWEAFAAYLNDRTLTAQARVLAPDRPGYGGSGAGVPVPSMAAQAAAMAAILRAEGGGPAVVLGHSLGGPVAARLAMDDPALVRSLILVAPSIDPAMEKTMWYQRAADSRALRWLVPQDLDVCNREILPLKGELEAMLPLWAKVQAPVQLIQGMEDDLVPPENADFAQRMLKPEQLKVTRVPGLNHFVPWARKDLLDSAIMAALSSTSKP